MRKFDTESFVPVASLNGVVGLPSSFNRFLIDITGKYDILCTLMQNEYTLLKLSHVP